MSLTTFLYLAAGVIPFVMIGSVTVRAGWRLAHRHDRRALREFLQAVAWWFVAVAFFAVVLVSLFDLPRNVYSLILAMAYAALVVASLIYRQEDDGSSRD